MEDPAKLQDVPKDEDNFTTLFENSDSIEQLQQKFEFHVLVDGEASCIECNDESEGLFLTEESLFVPYENIVYFEIPTYDTGDVFEFDSHSVSDNYSPSLLSTANSSNSSSTTSLAHKHQHHNSNPTKLTANRRDRKNESNAAEAKELIDRSEKEQVLESPRTIVADPNEECTSLQDHVEEYEMDESESYHEVYEGLFIGYISFVQIVDSKEDPGVEVSSVLLEFQSLSELQTFDCFIRSQLEKQSWRPKKVLLFLNPASGRGKAVSCYEESIANTLRLAGVVADVRITDKDGANSVKGIIFSTNYSVYDAIVIVGGDGSYRDAIAAIYEKMHNQGKFDLDKDGVLPPIDINVGIIPCGSGNGVVHYLTRSFSLDHAVAALVLGKTTPLPVVCVRNRDKERSLVGLAIVCVNYGITSDAIVVANRWKFLGPGKYIIGVTSAMLKHKSFRANIKMQQLQNTSKHNSQSNAGERSIEGEFKDLMMLVNGISDAGEVPRKPRASGDVFVTPGCTIFQQTGFLVNLGLYSQKIYNDDTVNCYKSNKVLFDLLDGNKERSETKSFINLDGDIYPLKEDAFEITYCPSLVNAYALGFQAS